MRRSVATQDDYEIHWFMKSDTQPTWFTLHPWALYFLEISRVAFLENEDQSFKTPCSSPSTQYLVVTIYFLHPADNKLWQYFIPRTPNDTEFRNFELQGWSCMQKRFPIGFRISWTSSRELQIPNLCVQWEITKDIKYSSVFVNYILSFGFTPITPSWCKLFWP